MSELLSSYSCFPCLCPGRGRAHHSIGIFQVLASQTRDCLEPRRRQVPHSGSRLHEALNANCRGAYQKGVILFPWDRFCPITKASVLYNIGIFCNLPLTLIASVAILCQQNCALSDHGGSFLAISEVYAESTGREHEGPF